MDRMDNQNSGCVGVLVFLIIAGMCVWGALYVVAAMKNP